MKAARIHFETLPPEAKRDAMLRLDSEGYSLSAIASATGFSMEAVAQILGKTQEAKVRTVR